MEFGLYQAKTRETLILLLISVQTGNSLASNQELNSYYITNNIAMQKEVCFNQTEKSHIAIMQT